MDLHVRLAELNIQLPQAPKPVAAYIPALRCGNLVMTSGQLPFRHGTLLAKGPVPSAVSLDTAQNAAQQCVLNALAALDQELRGDWSRVTRVARLGVFVLCDPGYEDQPKVANGASDLVLQIFGDAGKHVRTAVGCHALPLGATVELEMTIEAR